VKHIRQISILKFWVFILFIIILTSCSEREKKNPFDISGNPESPVTLELSYQGSFVSLRWQVKDLTDFDGFRIYRATGTDSNFQFLERVPASDREYIDRSIQNYRWYYYYVTITSAAGESTPSNKVKTYPGPGYVWILSNLGFVINKYSYDLLHSLQTFETSYPPVAWSVYLPDSLIWLAFGTFSRVAPYNLKKGSEEYFITQGLDRPIDIIYSPELQQTFVLDNRKRQVIIIQGANITGSISLPDENFTEMVIDSNREMLYILGENRLLRLSLLSPTQSVGWIHTPGFEGRDIQIKSGRLYMLLESTDLEISQFLFQDIATQKWDTLTLSGKFYRMAVDPERQSIYLGEEKSNQKSALLKLSFTGERLFERNNFFSIGDIGINPIDHSIVIIDRFADTFYLFDSEGNLISKQTGFYDPIRVFIEE